MEVIVVAVVVVISIFDRITAAVTRFIRTSIEKDDGAFGQSQSLGAQLTR